MITADEIRTALSLFAEPHASAGVQVVTTQYLYPSNEFVSVHVSRAMSGNLIVSDGGGAMDTLSAHGVFIDDPRKVFANLERQWGVRFERGVIRTARLPKSRNLLANAVVSVAKASAHAADHALTEYRPRLRRNLESAIFDTLQRHVSIARIHRNRRMTGESNRQYVFDFSVPLGKGMLILDAVEPEPSSLLAKFASHMDVSRSGRQVQQRIVYDDKEEWKAEDLALLQMAARLVPLSRLQREMKGLVQ